MSSLVAIAGVLLIAAISPGPNNLVVMRAAARSGFTHALPAVAGILLGSVVLLAAAVAGVGVLLAKWPLLGALIGIGGGLYLVWLGLSLLLVANVDGAEPELPAGVAGMFGFQFINPKAWMIVLSIVSSAQAGSALDTFTRLAPLLVCVSLACLSLWAAFGSALSGYLIRPNVRRWTDRILGALLILSAALLFA